MLLEAPATTVTISICQALFSAANGGGVQEKSSPAAGAVGAIVGSMSGDFRRFLLT